MKLTHGLAALSLLALGAAAHADVTGTVTVVSDYDWRDINRIGPLLRSRHVRGKAVFHIEQKVDRR